MKYKLVAEVYTVGKATEEEIKEYISSVVLGCGACSIDNPFVSD
jgi:hypothetical protein